MGRAAHAIVAAIAGGLTLAGCSALGTTTATPATPTSTARSKLAQAQATHEYPSPTPPPQTAAGAAATPVAAIRSFATDYINWQADTVTAQMRALAAASIGQARSAMELAAAETAQDYELQNGGIANSGTVEAVAPLRNERNDQYVVVTLERTTATATDAYQGLRPEWHIALATVVQLSPGQWVLSRWQPET